MKLFGLNKMFRLAKSNPTLWQGYKCDVKLNLQKNLDNA